MHIRPFKAVFPAWRKIKSADAFLSSVKEDYADFRQKGWFDTSVHPAFHIYQIRTTHRLHTALLACTDIRDYLEGDIRKHEHTLALKEAKQMELLQQRRASVKPVTLAYPDVEAINQLLRDYTTRIEPDIVVKVEEETHSIWAVEERVGIEKLQALFNERVPRAYIADGHHRSAATARQFLEHHKSVDYNQLLCAFFPSSELEIHDFNRVVKDLGSLSSTSFMARLSALFHIVPLGQAHKPERKHELLLHIDEEWYHLVWKPEILKQYADQPVVLDAHLLNEWVMKDVLGIKDVRNDPRISYVEGPRGLDAIRHKVEKGSTDRLAFCLYPVQLEEMYQVADAQRELPPKSTWFEPRMKNGLIVLEYPKT
jgi:uncharacterized protein (DUF1015 family)